MTIIRSMAWWKRRQRPLQPRSDISISDPALAEYFRVGQPSYAGVSVGEGSALGLSAFYRAAALISGTIAMLPLYTERVEQGQVTRLTSVLDNPGAVAGMTPFEWKQTIILHQVFHGDAFLAHISNMAGGLAGLVPIHPLAVQIDQPPRESRSQLDVPYRQTYTALLNDGSRVQFTAGVNMTHCPALTLESGSNRRGVSLIQVARNSLGIGIAGDRAAAKMFGNGALMGGLITPEEGEEVAEADTKTIRASLETNALGWEGAGGLALVNRRLKLSPWTMSNRDAQFLESRAFQVEEISRWTGVPPHLLMQTEKQTSWGAGVAEQNRGLSRYNLAHWTTRLQERLSMLLARPRNARFDYAEWEKPTPELHVETLVKQVQAGLITVNEARAELGRRPIVGGDALGLAAAPPALIEETVSA